MKLSGNRVKLIIASPCAPVRALIRALDAVDNAVGKWQVQRCEAEPKIKTRETIR
jgi:hypothetical protein